MPFVTHGYLACLDAPLTKLCMETLCDHRRGTERLDSQLRRLKIEYEIFFSNPNKRPPTDIEWKVLALLRKFSDGGRMNFSQRYRYNEMAQRYAVYSDLWRKKSRIREEGYRRPQDALLSVQGVRVAEDEHKAAAPSRVRRKPRRRCCSRRDAGASRRNPSRCTVSTRPSASRSNVSTTLWSQPRRKLERTSPAASIRSPRSSRKRPSRSQAVPLPGRRILRRTHRRPRQAESQSEDVEQRSHNQS